ncbi:MAG: glycosyltransferase family 1 protein [Dolichospermum sp.]
MKVLYLHHNQPDYLAESLFHGLRTLLGKNCVDVPRYDSLYKPLTDKMRSKLRGNGFTLYGLLEDIPELAQERFFWQQDIDTYDLIVIANIWEQWQQFWSVLSQYKLNNIVVLDGADQPAFFPYASIKDKILNYPLSFLTPISKVKYFKRELMSGGYRYGIDKYLPSWLHSWLPVAENAIPISFSIPLEKITPIENMQKIKDFPIHIVDLEVAKNINEARFSELGSNTYFFQSENDYYQDLQQSRFGITTKRAGWDCLRHYELAANGCILCFRDIDQKPDTCAPHGLNESNCIIYNSYEDLMNKIHSLSPQKYLQLQHLTYDWIKNNSTIARAKLFLDSCFKN